MKQARLQGRPKDLEKRGAILAAAGCLFLEQGFERTTVEAIAARAGVSKLTVYSHFDGKEGLFKALILDKCEEHFGERDFPSLAELGPHAALTRIAFAFLKLMFHPDVVALHRVLATGHDEQMNRTFWETGPARILAGFAGLLQRFHAGGALEVPHPALAAEQFFSLLRGVEHLRAILNVGPPPSARRLEEYGAAAVAMFVRAYAIR